jgi:hypothetical protein
MQYAKHYHVYVGFHSLTVFSVFRKILKVYTIDGAYSGKRTKHITKLLKNMSLQ